MSARPPRSILANSVYLGLSFVAKILLYALLARLFSRADLGILLYSLAVLDLALGVSSFGVPQLAIREISGGRRDVVAFFTNLLALRLLFALVALGFVVVATSLGMVGASDIPGAIVLVIALGVVPKTLSECFDVWFAVQEQFIYPAVLETAHHVLFVAGCLLLVLYDVRLETIAWLYLTVACVAALARGLLLRGRVLLRRRALSLRASLEILRSLAPFGALGLTLVLYLRLGDVLIVRLAPAGAQQLASFKMAHLPVVFLIGLLGSSVMPFYGNVTRLQGAADLAAPAELARRLHQTLRMVLIVAGVLVLAPAVFAEEVMVAVCGSRWASSAPLLRLLLCHAALPAVTSIVGRALQATGREGRLALAAVAVLTVKVVALLVVLPDSGAWGLAVVTVATAALFLVVVAALAWPLLRQPGGTRVGVTAAILLVALGLAYGRPMSWSVADALLAYGVLAGLLMATRSVSREDVAALLRRRASARSQR